MGTPRGYTSMTNGGNTKWLPRVGRNPMVRKCAMVLMLFFMVYLFTILNLSLVLGMGSPRPSNVVKAEIVQLSEEYIRALAKENGDIVDGPYAGRFTAFDLKKTIAVLLESMLSRITRLEIMVNNVTNGSFLNDHNNATLVNANIISKSLNVVPLGNGASSTKFQVEKKEAVLSATDLLKGKSEKCELTQEEMRQYPHCKGKIEWMRNMWKSDSCYKEYGVDGSDCSIIMYLSEVEGYCPKHAWSGIKPNKTVEEPSVVFANVILDHKGLMELLKDPNERQGYAWIRMRITRMWNQWKKAALHLVSSQNMQHRPKQKILIHLGLLSKQTGWHFAENQFKGGPLGELVQWSDLISCLYILGHELKITSETEQLVELMNHVPAAKTPCQSRKELPVELIYTDIAGLQQLKKKLKAGYAKFGCMFRVVDSFGTEPAFNHRQFAKQNKILSSWGGQDLHPLQFNTMFPHSPDNTFLGFVVEKLLNDTASVSNYTKKDIALVYGKNDYMWLNKNKYLDIIHGYLQVHGTVYSSEKEKLKNVPSYVVNHGILSGQELHLLLQDTKIFVGLGFPYEGPAALEAIANGAVFLNPKFNPPHNSKNNKFFKGKPTLREITSQHPYAEDFIGRPYVYTIDMNNPTEVQNAVKEILANQQFKPYLPFEYTEEGMLQRVNAFLLNQNFCEHSKKSDSVWPPRHAIEIIVSDPGKSCKNICWEKNKICAPSYFPEINNQAQLTNATQCASHSQASNIYFPAFDTQSKVCTTQADQLLFSCVGSSPSLRRICPCRNYIPGQTALCIGCER